MITQPIIDSFETKTGIRVHVRPLMAEDAPYLVDLFEHMSSESRYNRFMQAIDHIDIDRIWSEAEHIAHLIDGDSYGLVAFVDLPDRDHTPVGSARFVRFSPQQAEIAVSVRDDLQHMGIGTHLLQLLIETASEQGIEQLVGIARNSNEPMWAMLKKLGYRLERQSEGSYSQIVLHISEVRGAANGWPDTAADYSPEPQLIG
ncbi:MAG TPA: GNAT family protein [Promineifilum sp.]|nr:GNAT family protein [Promineifilum sp.]HRO25104.1 GNAT family protein [Promineifilum sp.]HRO91652.1 GNAT family protein [Promineifilum sp.]HRQ12887.1 GNAT family protein [Promineifilum sp.]